MTRIDASLSAALLAGKPDLDAIFERPTNETQLFNLISNVDRTLTTNQFTLSYQGVTSVPIVLQPIPAGADDNAVQDAAVLDAAAIEAALEGMFHPVTGDDLLTDVEVTGDGSLRDPWQVKILNGVKDTRGNYLPLRLTGSVTTSIITAPADIADAAASTRPSVSLSTPLDFQRVIYDRSLEGVEVRGGRGDDTFISDDTMAAMLVYGDQGNDNFLIGRVIKTKTVIVDGQLVEIIDGLDGITPGVSFNATFFGGRGDDYFEVNHNIGELQLFGEAGDDTFFLKAQLQERPDGTGGAGTGTNVQELAGGEIIAGAGDTQNNIEPDDNDVLIDFVENNRVEIFGGSGFDTVVVAGTQLADTFYIFNDEDGRQFLFGAGLKLENVQGVERLALITGAGDDTVYLYGLNEELSLLVSMGSGNDRLIVGGPEETFQVTYPASNAVYTVEQMLLEDTFVRQQTITNDIQFVARDLSLTQQQEAFRDFYSKWVKSDLKPDELAALSIDKQHWNLLESNLAVVLKLFAQAVDKAVLAPTIPLSSFPKPGQTYAQWRAEAAAYPIAVNSYEQILQNLNANRWALQTVQVRKEDCCFLGLGTRTIYSSRLYPALLGDYHPMLPSQVAFDTQANFVPASNFYAGFPLDFTLFEFYLKPVVAYTISGDIARAEQVRQGTGLYSPRIAPWGYEPDLFLTDLYTQQVPAGGWMPRVDGEKADSIEVSWSSGQGAKLFWDLMTLFYDVKTVAPRQQGQYPGDVRGVGSARGRLLPL